MALVNPVVLSAVQSVVQRVDDVRATLKLARQYGGAAAAYSIRDIGADGGAVVRVRRSTGGEQDFSASEITSGALATYVGAGNDGFVKTWYDQSGNGNNATNTTTSEQPTIVSSGTYVGGVKFTGAADGSSPTFFTTDSRIGYTASHFCTYVIDDKIDQSLFTAIIGGRAQSSAVGYHIGVSSSERPQVFYYGTGGDSNNDSAGAADALNTTETALITIERSGQNVKGYKNGNLTDINYLAHNITTPTQDFNRIGTSQRLDQTVTGFGLGAILKEVIMWESDLSGDRSDIETNIKDYYSIT